MKTAFTIPLAFALLSVTSLHALPSIAQFDPEEARSLDWSVVNDGVMGGLSKGKLKVSEEGILSFTGNLSLENNGGFSSIRTDRLEMNLSSAKGVLARVRGDGRTYQIRFNTDARYRGMEVSFMAEFPTKKGSWTEVRIPFEAFDGTFRGRSLPKEKFDPSKISRVGILIADKKAGPFDLKVDWIRTYGGKSDSPANKDIVSVALKDGRFGTFATALKEAELVSFLQSDGPFTVFAPTDKAFESLPKGTVAELLKPENKGELQRILKHHVLSGSISLANGLDAGKAKSLLGEEIRISFGKGKVRVNEATLSDADIICSNGVIHVIDSVILPPRPANDIANIAKRAGNFKTLLAAVETAGLTDALSGKGPLTVLAPTDEAFAKLPEETVKSLLKPENRDQLKQILALHVIPNRVSAGDALNTGKAKAISGGGLEFRIDGGTFKVNGATIVKTDIEADNGIIHVIDSVLLPESRKETGRTTGNTGMEPLKLIEDAIHRGVPVFNKGDHEKCCSIYRQALTEVMKDANLDPELSSTLDKIIGKSDRMDDPTKKAWILRFGLDHAYDSISSN